MKNLTRPFIPIPADKLKHFKSRAVHVSWQRVAGMRWILKEIVGGRVRLETERTQKTLWTDASSLCYTRKSEPLIEASSEAPSEPQDPIVESK
jgi:hypothetical protein